ncbi:hypothetical protein [Nocardia jejuensis]|uniref:hypothetical protein n=1 Tax=Nocardia jejuensis TaxID=328049 RepID=UPI00083062F0|nr:hypothetical protein [Nocardia jejuensis]
MQPEYAGFLAACVRERRRELNLSLDDVIAAGGPTRRTLVRVEAATLGPTPKPVTFRRLDTSLDWHSGSAAKAYWRGEKPQTAQRRTLDPGTASVAVPAAMALALFDSQIGLNKLLDHGPLDEQALRAAAGDLNSHLGRLLGLYLTDLLERNRGAEASVLPLVEHAFGPLLNEPAHPQDPDYEDRLYRRWLIGRTCDLPADLAGKFCARLRQAREDTGEWPLSAS